MENSEKQNTEKPTSKLKEMKEELAKRMNFWIQISAYYRIDIAKETIRLYSVDVMEFTVDQLSEAFKVWRNDGSIKPEMPLPMNLKAIIWPKRSNRDLANEIVANLIRCCKQWNPYRTLGAVEWRAWVIANFGESTQAVVERMGGLSRIYREWNETRSPEIWKAQTRDLALAILNAAEKGILDVPPALPSPASEKINSLVESTLKTLPGGKK